VPEILKASGAAEGLGTATTIGWRGGCSLGLPGSSSQQATVLPVVGPGFLLGFFFLVPVVADM
jgi:hypothetical protein